MKPFQPGRSLRISRVLLIGAFIALSVWSYALREAHLNRLTTKNHQWLTASTKIFTDNWLARGAVSLAFAMYQYEASIEFPRLSDQELYISYPPGALLLPYLGARLAGEQEISFRLIRLCGIITQVAIAWMVMVLVWDMAKSSGITVRWVLSLLALAYVLFTQDLFYYFGMVYYSDQAVLLWTTLLVFIEYFQRTRNLTGKARFWLSVAGGTAAFFGVLTDYYALLVCSGVLVANVYEDPMKISTDTLFRAVKRSSAVCIGTSSALILFILQLYSLSGFDLLYSRFALRTIGLRPERHDSLPDNLLKIVMERFTPTLSFLMALTVVIVVITLYRMRRQASLQRGLSEGRSLTSWFAGIVLAPALLHVMLLINHTSVHHFSIMKQHIVIVLAMFGYIPAWVIRRSLSEVARRHSWLSRPVAMKAIYAMAVLLVVRYVVRSFDASERSFFGKPLQEFEMASVLHDHAAWEDVYYSNVVKMASIPPHYVAISKKPVHQVFTVDELTRSMIAIERISRPAMPRFWWIRHAADTIPADFRKFVSMETAYRRGDIVIQRVAYPATDVQDEN